MSKIVDLRVLSEVYETREDLQIPPGGVQDTAASWQGDIPQGQPQYLRVRWEGLQAVLSEPLSFGKTLS